MCSFDQAELDKHPLFSQRIIISGVDQIFIRGEYDCGVLQDFIQRLKYHHWTGATESLDLVIKPLLDALPNFPKNTVLIPIPLHPRRQRFRGFNQSDLIAQAISQDRGWPAEQLLSRQRHTSPQAQLSEAQRQTNLEDAFVIRPGVEKIPRSGILVDDVLTTGSTIAECAAVLRQQGMKHIAAIALAKG